MSDKQPAIRRRNSWTVGSLAGALFLLMAGSAVGQSFTLAWDKSPTVGFTNYVLYGSTNALTWANLSNSVTKMNTGTNLAAEITAKEGRYWFTVTAIDNGVQSTNSNIIIVDVPKPPPFLYTLVVQYGGTVDAVTNEAMYVRLKPIP